MTDNKLFLDDKPMSLLQYTTIAICFVMNMLDGMDVQVISFTASAILKEWKVSPQAFGVVFSAGLLGMTVGTLLIAPFGDKIGRKKIILLSGAIMGICIYFTSTATTIPQLLAFRFLSGLGIGCMLASTATLTAEYAPNKSRNFYVSFILAGYPIGAIITGLVAAKVIPTEGWNQMFRIAGIASMISLPLIYFFLSESIDFYLKKQPSNALSKVNNILSKLGIEPFEKLPHMDHNVTSSLPIDKLLNTSYRKSSLILWAALFMIFGSMYFLVSWIPKLAEDAGLSSSLAIYAGTVFNIGAFFGIVTQGYLSSKFGLKKTIKIMLTLSGLLMACFGLFIGSDLILLVFALLGFGVQGGFVGLYAVAARLYPTEFRSTGIGWAMGAGRLGGIIGPMLGGLLIGGGLSIGYNFLVFAIPAVLAGVLTERITAKEVS